MIPSADIQWLLTSNGKWHGWPNGGRASLCGRVNVEHLRASPATAIATAVPSDGTPCGTCAKKSGYVPPAENGLRATVDPVVGEWVGYLRRHLRHVHIQTSEATIAELATRLAEIGPPTVEEAREVFEQVRVLLLTPVSTRRKGRGGRGMTVMTLPYLKDTLDKLPPREGVLKQLAATMRMWRNITRRDPTQDKFRPDRVIETMLQVPSPEQYITHLNSRGLYHLAAMFHPNTLERAKKETALRGTFAGSSDYWDRTASQLNIVTD